MSLSGSQETGFLTLICDNSLASKSPEGTECTKQSLRVFDVPIA